MLIGQGANNSVLPGATLMDGDVVNLGATQNDFAIPADATSIHVFANAAGLSITGFAGGQNGRMLRVVNHPLSPQSFTLANASGASLAPNRLNLGGGSIVLAPGDMLDLYCPLANANGWNLSSWSKAGGGGGGGGALGAYVTALVPAGANNNFAPAGFGASTGRLDLDPSLGASNITGLIAGTDGQEVIITNIDAVNNLTLNNQNAGSTAANRFRIAADIVLVPNAAVVAVYYAGTVNRWVIKT